MQKEKPKVCLNLEYKRFMGGIFYKNIGTGVLSSYKNQMRILDNQKIEYTERTKDKDYQIIHINLMGPMALYYIKRDRKKGRKIISYAHNTPEDFKNVFRFSNLVEPLFKKFLVYMHNQVDLVICPSEYTKSLMDNHGIKAPLVPMSNAVDTKKYAFDEAKRKNARKKYNLKSVTVFSVGLVLPRKSPDTMISLAKKFPKNDFVWFGKIYSGLLAKKLPKKLPKNIQFTGFVDDIQAAFSAGDIFVFPSYEENEGMVILEAAAAGRPIVVRDIPVYQGWLRHGENCFKAKNQKEFEQYIGMLIKDKKLRDKMGKEALKLAQNNSIEKIGERLEKIYSDLLKS